MSSELFDLNGGTGLLSSELAGTHGMYIVTPTGSRFVTLEELKTFINTDPTIVPSSVPWRGARLRRTSDAIGLTTGSVIVWQDAVIDTESSWSLGAPTRITIPVNINKVRFRWSLNFESLNSAGSVAALLKKNGSYASGTDNYGFTTVRNYTTGFNDNRSIGFSSTLSVVAGDYFEIVAAISMSSQDQVIAGATTFFEMEVVEAGS